MRLVLLWATHSRGNQKPSKIKSQLVRCYDVWKMSVSFRYQLKRLCDYLSRSISLRYQLIHHYGVSDWSVLFTYQWHVAKTSQIDPLYWLTSCDDVMMSKHIPRRSNWLVKWTNFHCVQGTTFFRHLWWFSVIKVPASTLLQCLKGVGLI